MSITKAKLKTAGAEQYLADVADSGENIDHEVLSKARYKLQATEKSLWGGKRISTLTKYERRMRLPGNLHNPRHS